MTTKSMFTAAMSLTLLISGASLALSAAADGEHGETAENCGLEGGNYVEGGVARLGGTFVMTVDVSGDSLSWTFENTAAGIRATGGLMDFGEYTCTAKELVGSIIIDGHAHDILINGHMSDGKPWKLLTANILNHPVAHQFNPEVMNHNGQVHFVGQDD